MKREQPDKVLRGQMYYANLDPVIGSEQGGTRPVLVIQNDVGNCFSPTLIVAPITTRVKRANQPTHIGIPPLYGLPQSSTESDLCCQVEPQNHMGRHIYMNKVSGATNLKHHS